MKENIIFFCAHSDDETISGGATILKFIEEKKNVIKVIFSKGQLSHPHLREKVITKKRKRETEEINKIIGIKKTIYFNLTDGKLKQELPNVKEEVKNIIKIYKPKKIFINSHLDPHPEHRAVSNFMNEIIKSIKYKNELYEFEVWNVKDENLPSVYIDITPYFKKKMEIVKLYRSQWISIYLLQIPMYFRAKSYGKKINCRFAERFYKIK